MDLRACHVGIDFDNTIVCYDGVFHRVARERGLLPDTVPATKLAVRNWLREAGREDDWTEMQGYVYGARMSDAETYPGVAGFLARARDAGLALSIVSHKTRHPFAGEKYDLHGAARAWAGKFLRDERGPFLPPERIHFETTKEAKWARIGEVGATHFIDDLPEILTAAAFPRGVERILFDPDRHHGAIEGLQVVHGWSELTAAWFPS